MRGSDDCNLKTPCSEDGESQPSVNVTEINQNKDCLGWNGNDASGVMVEE